VKKKEPSKRKSKKERRTSELGKGGERGKKNPLSARGVATVRPEKKKRDLRSFTPDQGKGKMRVRS